MHIIDTGTLTLLPQTAAHAEEMFAVLSDPAIYTFENEAPESVGWLRSRFTKLESRVSPDGHEHWLNWVVRLRAVGLIGYVQATIHANNRASIAYVFASAHWGRGHATDAVRAMIDELVSHYRAQRIAAVFKRENQRSMRLLNRLGFSPATAGQRDDSMAPDEELFLLPNELAKSITGDLRRDEIK